MLGGDWRGRVERLTCGMPYREGAPPPPDPVLRELDAYEQQLLRTGRRTRLVFALVVGGTALLGIGSCVGPPTYDATTTAWRQRKTKLTTQEASEIGAVLDAVEADAKKSQAAFDAVWPRLRDHELGPRRDLGTCRVTVPGPTIERKDSSTSLKDSSQSEYWTFVDLTRGSARSPLERLKMPGQPLRTAPGDNPPTLRSTTAALAVAEYRKRAAAPVQHDGHLELLRQVTSFAASIRTVDVVVFVDAWKNPKFSDETPSDRKDLAALERGALPTRTFEGGLAIARAFAWSAAKREIVCASQNVARNSSDITFRSSDISPLQQDLVLQLERSLHRSFVAVGDAPPRLDRPEPDPTAGR